jgi:hypothetical protein
MAGFGRALSQAEGLKLGRKAVIASLRDISASLDIPTP